MKKLIRPYLSYSTYFPRKTNTFILNSYRGFCKKNFPRNQSFDQYNKIKNMGDNKIEKQNEEYDSDNEDQARFKSERQKTMFVILASSLVVGGVYLAFNFLQPDSNQIQEKQLGKVTYIGKPDIGGSWNLIRTDGKFITDKDLAGKYYLIYFGFTQCPDVCPHSLQKISKLLKNIRLSKEYKYFDLECIFVSIDPDRDSLERIKEYCNIFDNKIIGLTHLSNDNPELKDILKKFKIHSSKIYLSKDDIEEDRKSLEKNVPEVVKSMDSVAPKNNLKYSMDHTIVTYLFGTENNFLTYLSANLNADEMTNIVKDEIMNDLTKKLKKLPETKR